MGNDIIGVVPDLVALGIVGKTTETILGAGKRRKTRKRKHKRR